MGWLKTKANRVQDRAAINYRMRIAAQINSYNAAANLQEFVEIHAPKVDPGVEVPRTWSEFIVLARRMDSMPISEGREQYGDYSSEHPMELTRLATWLLGDHGVAERIAYKDFRYRWE